MKRFLKLNVFAIATLLFLGVADAWGLGIKKNVNLNLNAEIVEGEGKWNSNTKKLEWSQAWSNLFYLTDWNDCDLSQYDKMVINTSTVRTGNGKNAQTANAEYRVMLTIDEQNYTCNLTGGGEQVINIKTDFKNAEGKTPESVVANPFQNVASIRIGGRSGNGAITINSIYFHKPLAWDAEGKITFYAQDFNVGDNVTKNSNTYSFKYQYNDISLDFDNDGLAITDIESINILGTGTDNIHQCFRKEKNNRDPEAYDVNGAQNKKIDLGFFMIRASYNNVSFTLNSVTFTKKKYVFDVKADRIFFEDFEKLSNRGITIENVVSEAKKEEYANAPEGNYSYMQGKYLNYGGRGKLMQDPTFGTYYQNLADADEYTKSIAENFFRIILTGGQRTQINNTVGQTGEATIGFWVNGQVAVDYELPLERGSMFCMFSNLRFRKADDEEKPRFMFDLSCNGWTYSYMPASYDRPEGHVDYINQFFYEEKNKNSGVANPLESLFGKNNYENTLDQSKHKFYDDKKWHYVTYVMDKGNNNEGLSHVTVYVDGVKTGEIANVRDKNGYGLSNVEFNKENGDYVGRAQYLRNIVLGGFTPHGLFYDQQYYSDAALAYDDIAIYGKALTKEQIQSIIDQKQYTPKEWHYGSSFAEYNESKGGHEDPKDVSGLGVNGSFDNGNLVVNAGTQITIPNVPKNYYVRVEYYGDDNQSTSSASSNLVYVGYRNEAIGDSTFYVAAYKANESGTYKLNVESNISIRSIVITPYQYAQLKYGNWNANRKRFTALTNKSVQFNVERTNGVNTYFKVTKDKNTGKEVITNLGSDPALPELALIIDGKRNEKNSLVYEDMDEYMPGHNPYIKYTSTAPHVAHINQNGQITMTGIAGNTFIIAELISDNLFNGSEVVDSFEIRIKKEENTFRLEHGQTVSANDKFPSADSDKNLQNITLTIGGWNYNDQKYNIPGVGDVKDSWEAAKTWKGKVKGSQEVLDDFNQYIVGKNAAKSESLGRDDGEFYPGVALENNITPWTLPCRGAYAKFEPLKAGIVTMYLLQKGNLNTVVPLEDGKDYSTKVDWRPVYITDETGKIVDFVQTATNGRITYNDNFFIKDKRRAQFIESIPATYSETLRQDLLNLRDKYNDRFHTLIDNWNNAGWRQKVIPTGDGGYMVMSTAIVRYTFNVYPGKTYYLFSNQTQIGISGFNFEEDRLLDTKTQNYETAPVREVKVGNELNFTDVLNEKQPTIPTGGDDITHVTYERNFAQGKWSSICLPFSMNNRQLREQFGEESAVVLLKEIHDDGKIELIWHVNQDIIAGYPYFILPKGEVKHDNVSNSTITKISVDTYFNSEIKKEKPLFSVGSNGNTFNWQGSYNGECYKADYPYVFEGNYEKVELPAGSYVMANSGNLTKIKNATTAKPFRAYLKYQGSNSNNAKPLYTSINWQNEETTSIDDLMFENGILTESTDVYGIDGTVIRRDAQNISNLSKGVYIVNGKKFVVK